jgi:hypothetical protein
MGRSNFRIKAWALPLIVIGLVVPGSVGFIVAGPGLGLAVGALSAFVVVLVAAMKKPDEPIEVARAGDRRRRLLLVAIEPVDAPAAVDSLRSAALHGGDEAEVLVLAPAFNTPLSHWASDVGRSRLDAQRKLVLTVGALAAAEVEARGEVGDPDPLQAVEDTLRKFAADEVIVALPGTSRDSNAQSLIAELRRRLDRPVYSLRGDEAIPATY